MAFRFLQALFSSQGFRQAAILLLAGSPLFFSARAQDCASCHDSAAKVGKSAHAQVGCATCHVKHETYPHPEKLPKPSCATCHASQAGDHARSIHGKELKKGNAAAPNCDTCHGVAHETTPARTAEFHKNTPATCGMCHSEVQAKFEASVHGAAVTKGIVNAPVCTDCHGEHSILGPKDEASNVNANHVRDTCGRCHGDLRLARQFGLPADRLTTFDASFHGLAAKTGAQSVANCASCHGFHDVLPSSNPKSMTHTGNLAKTCGNCHPGAGTRFALGPIHQAEGAGEPAAVGWVRSFYLLAIPLVIGLMMLHHGGDYLRKLVSLRFSGALRAMAPAAGQPDRMLPLERMQHALLASSFLILVWSGFALKYPDQWWAVGGSLRGTIHRAAGAVLIAVSVLHVVLLGVRRDLREHWKEFIPNVEDAREASRGLAWSLCLRREKPYRSAHSYIEKAEYWAVVWGTFVMALTGVLLWANNWTLTMLPKAVLDIATAVHFYEAVLATLAIFVWHFYSVIFDPEVYPLDTAWLTGKSPRAHARHTHHSVGEESAKPNVESRP